MGPGKLTSEGEEEPCTGWGWAVVQWALQAAGAMGAGRDAAVQVGTSPQGHRSEFPASFVPSPASNSLP